MATVHLGRLLGPVGFSRTVAIKRLHAQFAADPEFVSMFLDEARVAARIRHPNVVPTLDVVTTDGELFLVMEYVPGESLAKLTRAVRERGERIPLPVMSAIMVGTLLGLHAAHEATDERGEPLHIVHRDVSPQNVLVGTDGVAKILDFGVAKAAGRIQTTREGQIKGKLAYMPPEQLRGGDVTRKCDVYAAGVMLWELLTGQRLFSGDNEGAVVARVLEGRIERPSSVLIRNRESILNADMAMIEALDATALRALAMDPNKRFATAREMADDIEQRCPAATFSVVSDWLQQVAKDVLRVRASLVSEIESSVSRPAIRGALFQELRGPETQRISSHPRQPSAPPESMHATVVGVPQRSAGGSGWPGRTPYEVMPTTQPSSISVSSGSGTSMAPPPARGRSSFVAVLLGVMAGAAILGYLFMARTRTTISPANPQGAAPSAATPPTPVPVTEPPVLTPDTPPPTPLAPPVLGVAPPSGSGAASATGPQTPPPKPAKPHHAQTKPQPPRPPPSSAPTTPPPPQDDCKTPYWYDAQGIKHYKEHCTK